MSPRRLSTLAPSAVLSLSLCLAVAAAPSEIKGAAILDHPGGKVAVKQMGLVNAGKMDEANKLSTKEMQDMWATTLTVQKKSSDADGSGTSTTTQSFKLAGGQCLISR